MMSAFLGLNIAARGLYAGQVALAVTTNNMSNVNTPGYSRQTPLQRAAGPAAVYNGYGRLGIGSQVDTVERIRDLRLDKSIGKKMIHWANGNPSKGCLLKLS
jgi:flagellar hook-associated protein 1 FlgK